jgi:PAS domain S-box-containing protein
MNSDHSAMSGPDVYERGAAALCAGGAPAREVLDTLPVAIYITDAQGRLTYFNPAAVEFSGRVPELGTDRWCVSWKLFHPDGTPMPHDQCPMAVTLREGRAVRGAEAMAERPDGVRVWFQPVPTPLLDDKGNVVGGINMLLDITDRKRAEKTLRESEELFRVIFDLGPAALYSCDTAGVITAFNRRAAELWGREPAPGDTDERFCGSFKLFGPDGTFMPHDRCPMARVVSGELAGVQDAEVLIERPDGTHVTVVVNIVALKNERGEVTGAVNCFYDVTERKRAETGAAHLAAIVTSSDDAIISKDLRGIIRTWNAGAERLFGYTSEEAVGKPVTLLIPPDRRGEEPEILARIGRGESIDHFETERLTKDGGLVPISLTVSPVKDSGGRIVGASKVARDISARKRAEAALVAHRNLLEERVEERTRDLVAAHERLRTSDRMASVGTLAAGLAHDMKSVLLPLGMRLDLILTSPGVDKEISTELAVVCALLDHLRAMARNLSLFAQDPEKEGTVGATDLAAWRDQVRGFIDASAGAAVVIKWEVSEDLPAAAIAPHRLTQAVLNLVHNARDAIAASRSPLVGMDGVGKIEVTAGVQPQGEEHGACIALSVRDDGCGMNEEVKRRCVEPFFTTKDRPAAAGAAGGTGLGLSLAHAIVERVGGSLEIESVRGEGTTVTLRLPLARAGVPAVRA